MTSRERPAYPTFPASCWWPLRERLKRSLPASITAEYLQAVLEVEPKTARNLVPMLRQMGLVDEAGAPRERANAWRVDAEYRQVCHAIRDELYPAALRHAVPDPAADFDAAVRWFMKASGVGTAAAKRMARFYTLLSKADPSEFRERIDRRSDAPLRRPTPRVRSGNSRLGDSRPGDPRLGESRPGDPRSGDPRPGDPRAGSSSNGSNDGSRYPNGSPGAQPPDSLSASLPQLGDHAVSPDGLTIRPTDAPSDASAAPTQLVVQIQLPPGATREQMDQLVASLARHFAPHLGGQREDPR